MGPEVARDGAGGLPLAGVGGDARGADGAGHVEDGVLLLAQCEIHARLPRSGMPPT